MNILIDAPRLLVVEEAKHICSPVRKQAQGDMLVFDDTDVAFFKSANGLQKTSDGLNKANMNLKVYINTAALQRGGNVHYTTGLDDYAPELSARIVADRTADPSLFQVLFNHNMGADRLPLTAWIAVHRAHHIVVASDIGSDSFWRLIDDALYDFMPANKRGLVLEKFDNSPLPSTSGDLARRFMGELLLTTNAGRNVNITNQLDVEAEMFAQYVLTGSVKLLPMNDWTERLDLIKKSPRTINLKSYVLDITQNDELRDFVIEDLENRLNCYFAKMVAGLAGKAFRY